MKGSSAIYSAPIVATGGVRTGMMLALSGSGQQLVLEVANPAHAEAAAPSRS